jgi:two-component system OmpR family response regulator
MKILVVDDDPRLRDLVRMALEGNGFDVQTASDGQAALVGAQRYRPDLIVLDVGLPKADGFEVCRRIRATSDVPILFLTAHDEEVDRVLGFELGADDYVTKPFSPRELVGRIRAILKRIEAQTNRTTHTKGRLRLDVDAFACAVDGVAVPLTSTEFSILHRLMRWPNQVHTRPQVIEDVWGAGSSVSDRTLDSHLRNLRRKLSDAGCPDAVETLHAVGIRLGPCSR